MNKIKLEYIWIDGQNPTSELRSKTKIVSYDSLYSANVNENNFSDVLGRMPEWNFDGSSTEQSKGRNSDCILVPISFCKDPFREGVSFLVMCEVMNPDGTPHETNKRNSLAKVSEEYKEEEALFGIEQEYILCEKILDKKVHGKRFYGWPQDLSSMTEQGRYYCGVGSDRILGRDIAEEHLEMCLKAELGITGINAEVMASQWEFQVGTLSALEVSDHLWLARWILHRVCENYEAVATLDPKPIEGWNGSGAHINFSTKEMREEGGIKAIEEACERLSKRHSEHIAAYGSGNEKRLTGGFETCDINTFRYGVADRGASIRIPRQVKENGCGYLEDRRPSSNVDPYVACEILIKTICLQEELVK